LGAFVKSATTKNEALRAQAVLLASTYGGGSQVQPLTGLTRTHAISLKQRYHEEGITCLVDKRKGKPKELLTTRQREAVLKTLKEKTPKDLGYGHDHWSSSVLGDWIEKKFKVKYKSKTSLYLIFKKVSFTYHRPGTTYDERDDFEVAAWQRSATRKLAQLMKEKDTLLLTGDEMVLTTATTVQKVWLPVGEYPKVEVRTGTRLRRHVYGFLNLRTGEEHAWKTGYQTMYVTKDILKNIRALYPKKKIALFWDNAGWHKGSVVKDFLREDGNIEIVWFPRYAPDENPQEKVWKAGRAAVTHNEYISDIDKAADDLVRFFNTTKFEYSFLGKSRIS
jgi:transposase